VYRILSIAIAVLLLPVWLPIAIYIGLTYHWTDTVPKEDDEGEHPS